jgi:hypothetical protein
MTNSREMASGTPEGAPAETLANDAPRAAVRSDAATHLAAAQAEAFLAALGKDPATTRLRAFPHKESTNRAQIGARKGGWDLKQAAAWNRQGRGVYVVTGNGGDKKEEITSCPALFAEWDHQPIEWQLSAWIELGLPEPSMQVRTGGRSVHNWWVMTEPINPAEFEALQIRLYTHCKSDNLKDPSRVMRLPGFAYIGPDDKPAGMAELVNVTGHRYTAANFKACLPELPTPEPTKPKPIALGFPLQVLPGGRATDLPPRGIDAINAAAGFIPRRVGGEGTYDSDRNALCGCSAALAEAGQPDPDGAALALLGHLWPDESAAAQVLTSTTTRKASSFWAIAKEHGYDTRRHDLKGKKRPQQNAKSVNSRNKPTTTSAISRGCLRSTGIQAVLAAPGSGWQPQEDGPPLRSNLAIGDFSVRLTYELGNRLGFDELALMPTVDRVPLKDWEVSLLHGELSEAGWKIGSADAAAGLLLAARRRPFHPVCEYLKRVEADPTINAFDLDEVAPRFFRATSALHKAMVRKWLIGAVARAMDHGCQMDYCLVAQSDVQGLGKSSAFRDLASPEWFTSTIPEQDKDWTLNVHCCWIFELAELESFTGAKAAGKIKNMLTTTTDLVRVPYGKAPERMKRPSVFCATVNKREFLRDDTGNRRFWVVPIEGTEKLDRDGLAVARDGIWKAAVLAYRSGELPMLPDGLADASEQQNDDFREQDPWADVVAAYLGHRQKAQDLPVRVPEVLEALQVPRERQTNQLAARARGIAEAIGWEWGQRRDQTQKQRKGLWPCGAPCGAPGAPCGAPGGATEQPSDSKASKQMVPPVPPKTPKESETKEIKQAQGQRTHPLHSCAGVSVAFSGAPGAPFPQTDCAATGLAGGPVAPSGAPVAPSVAPSGAPVKPPANSLTIKVEAPAAVALPTLRDLIAQAQADGELSEVELIVRVQCLAIAAGLEQPVGAQITMAALVMARSNG